MNKRRFDKILYWIFIATSAAILVFAMQNYGFQILFIGSILAFALVIRTILRFLDKRNQSTAPYSAVDLFTYLAFFIIPLSTLFFCYGFNENNARSVCRFDVFGIFTGLYNFVSATLFTSASSLFLIAIYSAIANRGSILVGKFFNNKNKVTDAQSNSSTSTSDPLQTHSQFGAIERIGNKNNRLNYTILIQTFEHIITVASFFALFIFMFKEVDIRRKMEITVGQKVLEHISANSQNSINTNNVSDAKNLNNTAQEQNIETKKFRCYWMETHSGEFRWVALRASYDKQRCFEADSCSGGLGGSGGGCYKWSEGPEADAVPWDR